ncbi:helix-turn-helix domain-containing protein [Pseudomonas sp. QTF5]|uniref:helix-turn-helix domain-containing protein n=1 Tax=Pseudomonas sp. QTF5 TaxID=1435425 RepID=UPI0004AEF586|nr:AraC family transcriptional regulator [Pseudomonas sp. QTF5]
MQIEPLCATAFPEVHLDERLLHLRVVENPVRLASANSAACCWLPVGWEGLIALDRVIHVSGGRVEVMKLSEAPLVKLQVFFDVSSALHDQGTCAQPWATLPVAYETLQSNKALERWYIQQALGGGLPYRTFASQLRHNESYGLVRFLLEQGSHSEKLSALAQRYGVSVSHFRRLCRQALGTAAKPALRGWRTAQALLNMNLKNGSLTDVALEFGFASSSHFSKEVRELMGFSPSSLADITYLSSK